MEKRITAMLLCFVMTFGVFASRPLSGYAAGNDEKTKSTAIRHLINLNIMDEPFWSETDNVITRAEFAALICDITDASVSAGTAFLSDVAHGDQYYDEISYCIAAGYINGYEDGTFNPDKPISGMEAAKILISVAGYNSYAYYKGGYPSGYAAAARDLELFANTGIQNRDEYINRKQAADMVYNTLICQFYAETKYNADGTVSYEVSRDTVSKRYLGLSFVRGIMYSNGVINVADVDLKDGMLLIGDAYYSFDDKSFMWLIGQSVECFALGDEKKAVSVASSGDSRTVTLQGKDISAVNGNKITYYDSADIKHTASLSGDAMYFLNGVPQLSFDLESIVKLSGAELYLVSNDASNTYRYVFVNQYTDIVVGNKAADGTVTDLFDSGKSVLIDEDEKNFIIMDEDGKQTDYLSVGTNNIISVMNGSNFVYVTVSNNLKSGALERKSARTITVGGEKYEFSDNLKGAVDALALGNNVKLYISARGEIVKIIEGDEVTEQYGYLYQCKREKSTLSSDLIFKIYTVSGELNTYTAKENLQINNDTVKLNSISGIPSLLLDQTTGEVKNTMIGFRTDSSGKINKIILPSKEYNSGESEFFSPTDGKKLRYYANASCFGIGTNYIDNKTVLLQVPSVNKSDDGYNDEDLFSVLDKSMLVTVDYAADLYYFSASEEYVNVAVFYGEARRISLNTGLSVFMGLYKSYKDGETCYEAEYFSGGEKLVCAVPNNMLEEFRKADKLDSVRITLDSNNNAIGFAVIYDYDGGADKKGEQLVTTASSFDSSVRLNSGYAVNKGNKIFRISKNNTPCTNSELYKLEGFGVGSAQIYIVESENGGSVKVGTIDDIMIGDKVVTYQRSSTLRSVVVYRNKSV